MHMNASGMYTHIYAYICTHVNGRGLGVSLISLMIYSNYTSYGNHVSSRYLSTLGTFVVCDLREEKERRKIKTIVQSGKQRVDSF